MKKSGSSFYHVYILRSVDDPTKHYTGFTNYLDLRLKEHNSGKVPYTRNFKPWILETSIAFQSRKKAVDFERYLKTRSGRAFARKRL